MAVVKKSKSGLDDMEHGNWTYFEQSLAGIGKQYLSSVKITDYPDSGNANPEPVIDYQDETLEDFLSPQFLKHITGKSSLSEVRILEMEVDTSETSIGNLGQLLPNLKQLKLSNSVITSIRDLGTCLNGLTTLWLQRCSLYDLDGISCFNSLKELYLAYNEINDLSSLSMLDNLSCLDLEGNNVDDIAQVEFLALCTKLVSLSLSGNPVETSPHPATAEKDLRFYDYRSAIAKAVPQLRILDDERFLFDIIDGKEAIRSTTSTRQPSDQNLKEDILLVQESLKALSIIEEDDDGGENDTNFASGENSKRPGSAFRFNGFRPTSSRVRPSSGRSRPISSRTRPTSGANRPLSSSRVKSRNSFASKSKSSAIQDRSDSSSDSSLRRPESVRSGLLTGAETPSNLDEDDSSDLTHGSRQVLCGNPVRALLARRKELKGEIKLKLDRSSPEVPSNQFIPEHSYHLEDDCDIPDKTMLFEELKKWREDFENTSRQLVASQGTEQEMVQKASVRSSLSPTPPSGNPSRSRPSRRKLPNPGENSRPQTASDFRSSDASEAKPVFRQPNFITSKSLDVKEISERSKASAHGDDESSSAKGEIVTDRTQSTHSENATRQIEGQHRTRFHRPGTAAAAYKKKTQKHFV